MMFYRGDYYNHGIDFFTRNNTFFNSVYGGWMALIGIGLLIITVIIACIFIKRYRKSAANAVPIETLKLKFAKGEISEEEYLRRKSVLEEK